MKIDFYICRHGQTDMNVQSRWAGSGIDIPLNEVGYKQAEELAQKLHLKMFDIYCSPLVRAVQTANVIARANVTQCDITIMQDLRECSFGDAEGVSFDEVRKQYGDVVDKLLWPTEETADLRFPNGESKREVFERVYGCLQKIAYTHTLEYAYHRVCVVCHAGVLSALQYGLGLKDVSYENCTLWHLQYDSYTRKFIQCRD